MSRLYPDPAQAKTIADLQARCRANAELARTDPDRRRRTVSVQLRIADQLAGQRKMRG
jgi:hypothetical protein